MPEKLKRNTKIHRNRNNKKKLGRSVCTRTLYNYVDQGLLNIHNYDLPEKLKRNTKIHRIRKNKKKLGRSIEQRISVMCLGIGNVILF